MFANGLRVTGAMALLVGLFLMAGIPASTAHAFTYDYKSAQKIYRGNGHYSYRNHFDYNKHGKAKHYGHRKKHAHKHHTHKPHKYSHYGHKKKHHGLGKQIVIIQGGSHYGSKPRKSYGHVSPQPAYKQYDRHVVVHGHVGKIVGKHLTSYDSVQVNQSLETVRTGESRSWYNDQTGKVFTVSLLKTYRDRNAHDCRDYRFHVKHHGQARSIEGSACRLDNGSWKLVS